MYSIASAALAATSEGQCKRHRGRLGALQREVWHEIAAKTGAEGLTRALAAAMVCSYLVRFRLAGLRAPGAALLLFVVGAAVELEDEVKSRR